MRVYGQIFQAARVAVHDHLMLIERRTRERFAHPALYVCCTLQSARRAHLYRHDSVMCRKSGLMRMVPSIPFHFHPLRSRCAGALPRLHLSVCHAGEPPPMEGESIVIPAGQTILFDLQESPRLRLLLVEGQLEFLDTTDVHLHAEWIMVRGEGSALTVGHEDAPFQNHATITLHGRRATAREIPSYGAKNIAVRYGTLDLHGVPKTPTWTRLGATAAAGAATLQLAEAVNWQPGDAVAIASSAWDPSEVEQRRIVGVSADNMTLTLDRGLDFEHWGELVVRLLCPCHACQGWRAFW